jgi:GNAT superfamily N-acetyltransferase
MSTPTAENLKIWEDETRAPYARTSLRAYPLQRTRIAMSACGSGKSSKGGGSKSKGKSAGGDVIVRTQALKTDTDHLATLRSALRDELGDDRDVLAGFAAFTKYDREGLALDVHFRTGSTITDEELDWAEELVHDNMAPLGHGWSPQALMDEFCEPSSRFALVTARAPPGKKKSKKAGAAPKPVAFAHFRFTLEGETRDEMAGAPVLLVRDLQVAPEAQRKGLGRHLCQLLELVARKHAMRGVMLLNPAGTPGATARAFVESKLRGFECVDERWAPSDPNLSAFGKSLGAPKAPPVAAAAKTAKAVKVPEPAAESSPISVLPAQDDERATEGPTPAAASESTAALETAFQKVAVAEEAPAPAPAPLFAAFASAPVAAPEAPKTISFADFGSAAPDSDASSDESEEGDVEDASEDEDAAGDAGEAEADDILGQLVEMFKAENGRDPTEEEVAQWVQTLKDASAEGGLVL